MFGTTGQLNYGTVLKHHIDDILKIHNQKRPRIETPACHAYDPLRGCLDPFSINPKALDRNQKHQPGMANGLGLDHA